MKQKYILLIALIIGLLIGVLIKECQADTLRIDYGFGVGSPTRTGYNIDTAILLDYHGYDVDTLLDTVFIGITAIDTFVTITGRGYHRVVLYGVYDGYPNEWYDIKTWELMLSTAATTVGSGQYACSLWAIDTSTAPDSVRSGVNLDIDDAAGNDVLNPTTGTNGSIIVMLDSGSYLVTGSSQRQVWQIEKSFDLTGNDSVAILGYSTYTLYVVSAPADTNLCLVYGVVRHNDQTLVKNAQVVITPPNVNQNICDSTFLVMPTEMITYTGPWNGYSDGYFADTVLKCSCMPDSTLMYKITVKKKNKVIGEFDINIPRDSGSYLVTGFSE